MTLSYTHAVPNGFAEVLHLVMDSYHDPTVWASRRAKARQLQRDWVVSSHIPLCDPSHSSPRGLQNCCLPQHGAIAHSRNVCLVCSIFLTGREQGPLLVCRRGSFPLLSKLDTSSPGNRYEPPRPLCHRHQSSLLLGSQDGSSRTDQPRCTGAGGPRIQGSLLS